MKTNKAVTSTPVFTHEGGKAGRQNSLTELKRAVATCMLWENTFYEKGSEIAERIEQLCDKVKPSDIAELALSTKNDLKLRHVPLFLALQLVRVHSPLAKATIESVIHRPDEMGEILSLYWRDGKKPIAAQLKKGLASSFRKFHAESLAKWDRDAVVKLRDVMFLTHPKPKDEAQAATWKQLVEGTLPTPDTWEVALSSGQDKRTVWTRLIEEDKLGDMALLMNLRNMLQVGVEPSLIGRAIEKKAPTSRALPFRYVSALRYAPQLIRSLDKGLSSAVAHIQKLPGSTVLVVDVSRSMDMAISNKSEMTRLNAAAALGIVLASATENFRLFTFSNNVVEVPAIPSLILVENISRSQSHGGTQLRAALQLIKKHCTKADRIIVVTDEQSQDGIEPAWAQYSYLINVAPYKPGLDTHSGWTRISGWSEKVVDWMRLEEQGRYD